MTVPDPLDSAAVEAQKDRIMDRVDQLIAARDELRTELAEARASLERAEQRWQDMANEKVAAEIRAADFKTRAESAAASLAAAREALDRIARAAEGVPDWRSMVEVAREALNAERPPAG